MRRGAPEFIVGLLLAVLLASYVVYTRRVVRDLRAEAQRSSRTYARVFRAINDTSAGAEDPALLLLDLSKGIVAQGVPVVVTDLHGRPTGTHANVPEGALENEQTLREYVAQLDRQNPPVVDSVVGKIHFGNTPLVRWLRIIPAIQATTAFILLMAFLYIVRTRG